MTTQKKPVENSQQIACQIADLMVDKKALDVQILDVRGLTTLTDFFVICTSESQPQSRAICNHLEDEMLKVGIKPWHKEGYEKLDWVLVDFVNIVAQIFSRESREYYDFERLWGDAKITKVESQ
ncbi:MAG: ribosome silencing factor [Candidatus Marinimicrobia bacterium]|nr:ribosome silencing factor [Candidatus Neomarinimicrobiota bacterium]